MLRPRLNLLPTSHSSSASCFPSSSSPDALPRLTAASYPYQLCRARTIRVRCCRSSVVQEGVSISRNPWLQLVFGLRTRQSRARRVKCRASHGLESHTYRRQVSFEASMISCRQSPLCVSQKFWVFFEPNILRCRPYVILLAAL